MKYDMTGSYELLNSLAARDGIVIFGGTEDMNIPLCELKQAFALNSDMYNRSVRDLSLQNAKEIYDRCVSALHPGCLLLHIGDADTDLFVKDADRFEGLLRELIRHIRTLSKGCEIAIISVKNPNNSETVAEMNRLIRYIADSERCQYGDITTRRVRNLRETQSVVSFVYSTGFVHPLKNKRPLYDLINIMFCYNQSLPC